MENKSVISGYAECPIRWTTDSLQFWLIELHVTVTQQQRGIYLADSAAVFSAALYSCTSFRCYYFC